MPRSLLFASAGGVLLGLLAFAGCTSTVVTTAAPRADAGQGQGQGQGGDDDSTTPGGDAGSGSDAGATELLQIEVIEPASPAKTCADACASEGYTCSTACSFDDAGPSAGEAVYDNGSNVSTVAVAACSDVPKASVAAGGGTESLNSYACCCLSPKHQKIAGSSPAKSCDDVCAAHGMKCDPYTTWDGADTTTYQGGAHESYEGDGDEIFHVDGCSTVPSPTYKQRTLSDYECGCD